ncbi:hypothetical protein B296_00008537 [Ensete ventricosum]|uniref:Uncharacterized protein n=1 Tax=Ensete ventricosum TaxID=4639 RepID=A0A426ZE59_ENSVE|nr:hypothetical protein B296_00008537 [Ensete ventricosum]
MVSEPRKGSEEEGWPATASPHAGPTTHDQPARAVVARSAVPTKGQAAGQHTQVAAAHDAPARGAAANDQPYCLCRGSGGGVEGGKERARASV